jgi:general secretion pathway protein A
MYEKHFGLTASPFTSMPDPHNLFMTPGHREALAGLAYAIIRRKGFAALVGEAGTGKTTLLRRTLEVISHVNPLTSFIVNPVLAPSEFIEFLLHKFGLRDLPASKAQRLIRFEHWLVEAQGAGKTPVLIVDEAHKLSFDTLEEIRLLSNLEHGPHRLLQIVLAGQPELDGRLNQPEFWQLKQRIAVRSRLERLSRVQVTGYLSHRWTRGGGNTPAPFTDDAISSIATASGGIPRLINAICDNALLLTFSGGGRTVSMREVVEAARDLNLKPPAAEISSDPPTLLPSGKHRSGPAIIRDLEAVTAANGGLE